MVGTLERTIQSEMWSEYWSVHAKSRASFWAMILESQILKTSSSESRAGPVPNVRRKTLEPVIYNNVQRGSTISTDELNSYARLKAAPYQHGQVNHSAEEWVKGIHHVNSIEGYWSRLKNSIRGTHVHVSSKHLWAYVAEFSYRYNMRKEPALMFDRLVASLSLPRLADG